MAAVDVVLVRGPQAERAAGVRKALAEVTGAEPNVREVPGLAGPNDFLHLLVDGGWVGLALALAKHLGGQFLEGFGNEMGDEAIKGAGEKTAKALKAAARHIWRQKSEFVEAMKRESAKPVVELVRQISLFRKMGLKAGQIVTFAVTVPSIDRSPGAPVTSEDPAEVIFQLVAVARCASVIRDAVLRYRKANPGHSAFKRNKDFSILIEVLPNGDVRVGDITITGDEGETGED